MPVLTTEGGFSLRLTIDVPGVMAGDRHRHDRGRAYREERLVCARVQLTSGRDDDRLGLAGHERGYVLARFCDGLDPALRAELTELVRRRGPAAKRFAETLAPIEIVVEDPHRGRRRIVARLQPPQLRRGDLRDIEFGLRELT
jgi:hypothetical protein